MSSSTCERSSRTSLLAPVAVCTRLLAPAIPLATCVRCFDGSLPTAVTAAPRARSWTFVTVLRVEVPAFFDPSCALRLKR